MQLYIEKIKKELVFAKLIIKNPKTMNKASEMMNYSLYQFAPSEDVPSIKRSHRSICSHTPSRKTMISSPNRSLLRVNNSKFEVSSINFFNSPNNSITKTQGNWDKVDPIDNTFPLNFKI